MSAGRQDAPAPAGARQTPASAQALLQGAIDYAGLFPPAQLEMAVAVAHYRQYLASAEGWALGRLVVPVSRLEEFAQAQAWEGEGAAWRLAAVGQGAPEAEGRAIDDFNRNFGGRAQVDVVEAVTASPEAVMARVAAHPGLVCYCELDPAAPGLHATAAAVQATGARAKLRTGGVRAEAIPPAARVLAFLELCQRLGLVSKATAGLHHGVRGRYPLTYAPEAPTAVMHGFLNVILAAAYLEAGGPSLGARHILEREQAAGLRFEAQGIVWQGTRWSVEQLAAARRRFTGFGSCSFEEPLEWLRRW